jgi:phospholipid N-methyltransferase
MMKKSIAIDKVRETPKSIKREKSMYREFFEHFLRNPKGVGAIVPLSVSVSHGLVKELIERQDNKPWHILEVGAGIGNVTKDILDFMKKDDVVDVIEIDQECCRILESRFSKDPRFHLHCLSIFDWNPSEHYDFIVSTLPLNAFGPDLVEKILTHYQKISNENAFCTYVEYIGLERLSLIFAKSKKRNTIKSRRKVIDNFHRSHLIEKDKILTNFLPCYVYHMKLNETIPGRKGSQNDH